jgi:hypothetical protein
MELGSVTLKRIGFFCFPIKHSTHTATALEQAAHSDHHHTLHFSAALGFVSGEF